MAALTGRTEGWAAGLQLAGLSLRGQRDVAGFVAAFTGSNRYVLDFLAEEVLERQPGPVRTFLLQTSVLGRLSGELCDAVTGRTDSQALLEQIEAAGCSWCRSMTCAAGGATTTCSPTCCAPGCRPSPPARWPSCSAAPRAGPPGTGWSTTLSGTRWPPAS